MTADTVHFGGPDREPGLLRDLLAERVAGVAPGGAIDWVTYYFRDRRLAASLVAAKRRGVDVRVTVDGHPRTSTANDAVLPILCEGLGEGLRVVRHPLDGHPAAKVLRPRLHEKVYCFSGPEPGVFVGSFNPSGDSPEEAPEVIREIGDHDRAYNDLVEMHHPALVDALVAHTRHVHAARHGLFDRFSPALNRPIVVEGTAVHFWPRVLPHPLIRWLGALERGSRVRLAASHISGAAAAILTRLARGGIEIEVLAESTHRRVPLSTERQLAEAGIPIRRVVHSEWIPMHNKFALVESGAQRASLFGSINWSNQSRRFNREIGVVARDPAIFDAYEGRWQVLCKQANPVDVF